MKRRQDGGRGDAAPAIDFERVRELARIASEFDLAEVEVDPSGRIRVVRRPAAPAGPAAAVTSLGAPFLPGPSALALLPATEAAGPDRAAAISSPFVGTFYGAASPEAEPFVRVGEIVRKGQVVCIVEAMKLMNEIESDYDGRVLEALVKNGDHVEYGQPLFRIEKL